MHDATVHCVHDPLLVALFYLVAVLGSYTALQLAIGIPAARSAGERRKAIVMAGTALGAGAIWAMHFIAMLACTMDLAVAYAPLTTLLSALIAVASCTASLAVAAAGVLTVPRLVAAGTLMGAGVAGMHYMGMAAMRMAATTHYDTTLTLLAVLIAIGASIAALWLAFHMRGFAQMTGSALVMGVAVCGMHYTAMYGARFAPAAAAPAAGSLGGANLGTTVFLVVTVLLAGMLAIDVSRRRRRASVQI